MSIAIISDEHFWSVTVTLADLITEKASTLPGMNLNFLLGTVKDSPEGKRSMILGIVLDWKRLNQRAHEERYRKPQKALAVAIRQIGRVLTLPELLKALQAIRGNLVAGVVVMECRQAQLILVDIIRICFEGLADEIPGYKEAAWLI